jgi:hypothetical protein
MPKRLSRFWGIKRSGHHAVILWVAHHFPNRIGYYNNVQQNLKNLIPPFALPTRVPASELPAVLDDVTFVNFEDKYFYDSSFIDAQVRERMGKPFDEDVIILRDPFNLLASRLKKWPFEKLETFHQNVIHLWKHYAREFAGLTSLIPNAVQVSYNEWFQSEAYRRRLSARLGLKFTDAGLNQMPGMGNGSSFQGFDCRHVAQRMKVLDRWNAFLDDDVYLKAFDDEVFDLSAILFPAVTEAVRQKIKPFNRELSPIDPNKPLPSWWVNPSHMPIKKSVIAKYVNRVFVETGSLVGDGIQMALDAGFKEVRSVEYSPWNYSATVKRFADRDNVKMYSGDSAVKLWDMISGVAVPMTFWLDGHFHENTKPEGMPMSPLLQELETISRHPMKIHTILIDDVRLFETYGLTQRQVVDALKRINADYQISFEDGFIPNDIMVAQVG